MATGRGTDPRSIASVTTTSGSTAIGGPAGSFAAADVGRRITGTGIPAGATLAAVASATAATLSANATATGTITATVAAGGDSGFGFTGWSPETEAESTTYTVAAVNAGTAYPDKIADTKTRSVQRVRT